MCANERKWAPSGRGSFEPGTTRAGTLGDILALRLKVRGVAGVISDGAIRDTPVIGKMDFPVYCSAAAAPPSMNSLHPVETQTPVGICGVPVYPGDIIVADDDGAIVVPRWPSAVRCGLSAITPMT